MRFSTTAIAAISFAVLAADARQVDSRRTRAHQKRFHRRNSNFTLTDFHQGQSFFDGFDFFNFPDPTHGLVEYVSQADATALNLAFVQDDGTTIMAVDNSTDLPEGTNRKSVRIQSKKSYSSGLIIMDAFAMPHGCGTWPAFWMVGPNWPNGGEIDILEGVNEQTNNQLTLHTAPGCTLDQNPVANTVDAATGLVKAFSSAVLGTACQSSGADNTGCAFSDTSANAYGHGFNIIAGGVMATLIDDSGISIYSFPRTAIPQDITNQTPDPTSWGVPTAFWSSSTCDISQHFQNMQIVFDTTLCGDFGNAAFSQTCSGTCSAAVANASNFDYAQWKVNYVAVYQ